MSSRTPVTYTSASSNVLADPDMTAAQISVCFGQAAPALRMSSPAVCGACKAVPTAPHELPCGHTHCFVCLDSRATAVKIDARSSSSEEQSSPLRLVMCPTCQKMVEFVPPYARACRVPSLCDFAGDTRRKPSRTWFARPSLRTSCATSAMILWSRRAALLAMQSTSFVRRASPYILQGMGSNVLHAHRRSLLHHLWLRQIRSSSPLSVICTSTARTRLQAAPGTRDVRSSLSIFECVNFLRTRRLLHPKKRAALCHRFPSRGRRRTRTTRRRRNWRRTNLRFSTRSTQRKRKSWASTLAVTDSTQRCIHCVSSAARSSPHYSVPRDPCASKPTVASSSIAAPRPSHACWSG